jgi:hypothetical protein
MIRSDVLLLMKEKQVAYEAAWDALQAEGERTDWSKFNTDEADIDGQGCGWLVALKDVVDKLESEATQEEVELWLRAEIETARQAVQNRMPNSHIFDTEEAGDQGQDIGRRDALQNVLGLLTDTTDGIPEDLIRWMEEITDDWAEIAVVS